MKWTNRGHELDTLAESYMAVKTIYIWGTGINGSKCIDFLEWLKIDIDFAIYFVDSNQEKQGTMYREHPVLSPEELFVRYNAESVVVSSNAEIGAILDAHNIPYYNVIESNTFEKNLFVQHFLCVYMLYKYGKLLSHSMDYNVTNRCNLNCQGCLNFNNEIQCAKDESLDGFKHHADTVFQKINVCYLFHFSGGEPFLAKELPDMMQYVIDTYGERIFNRYIITNGTILPSDNLLKALQTGSFYVVLDDYRDTVPIAQERIPQIEEKLRNYGIKYQIKKADTWTALSYGTDRCKLRDEETMIQRRDSCNTFCQHYSNGRIYSCCYEEYAHKAGIVRGADFIDLRNTSRKEILEYCTGYTETGYVPMCRQCLGLGKDAKVIKPAVQIPHKYK